MIIDILTERFYEILQDKLEITQMRSINGLVGKVKGKKSFEIVYSIKFNIISITFNDSINDEIYKIVREYSSVNCEIKITKKGEKTVMVIFKYLKL